MDQTETALVRTLEDELSKSLRELCRSEHRLGFWRKQPCPWVTYEDLLPSDVYRRLAADFPPLSVFRKDEGLLRYGQRPHDRYYLALKDNPKNLGEISARQLPIIWQSLVDTIHGENYLQFASEMLGQRPHKIRLAWHMSHRGSEVSPHKDSKKKLGTQIFYFSDEESWDPKWGGDTLLLSKPTIAAEGPDFHEFESQLQIDQFTNQSLFFMRTESSWHGVQRLDCPIGRFRKTFHVIFERARS